MTLIDFILLLVIAGVCGSIGQALSGYTRSGCLASVALGFIGALLGTWLAGVFGVREIFALSVGDHSFPIIWSIIGAALFVAVLRLISGPPR